MIKSTNVVVWLMLSALIAGSFTSCKAQRDTLGAVAQRTINVTGEAEIEVDPDIIEFTVTMKEYWKEEFEAGKKYEDYKTKVPMTSIEPAILAQIKAAGVKDDQIKVSAIGNYYRPAGKDFLVSKTLVLTVKDFKVIDAITKTIDSHGVSNMFISSLKHSDMDRLKNEVKLKALLAARTRAEFMLKGIGEKCGQVLMINESEYGYNPPVLYSRMEAKADVMGGENSATELRKIKISYKVNATFAIEG